VAASAPQASSARVTAPTALLFTLCFILAQADKQVMGLLAVPVQTSFALTDTELGLLQGGAFALAFAIGGLPIAALSDRGHRVRIAAACVALWSLATILCGLATSFAMLVLFRAATAVAEAGLPPAALSIFAQSGDRRATARLTTQFMLAPFIGGGLVLLLGGMLIQAAAESSLPIVARAEPWRLVFLAVGLPGLALALLLVCFAEEPRRARTSSAGHRQDYRPVLRMIFVESRFLRLYYPGLTGFYLMVAALGGWYPAFLVRDHGLSVSAAGGYAGLTYLVAGIAGTLAAVALVSRRKGLSAAAMVHGSAAVAALLIPLAAALPLVGPLGWSLALYALCAFLSAALIAVMVVPIQLCLDNAMLARGLAVYSLLMSALAGSAGPLLVGLLSGAGLPLGMALAATGAAAMAAATVLLTLSAGAIASESAART
jgi:MFS family permease